MAFFSNTDKQVDNKVLKFIAIGDGVTKNLSVYEYGDDLIAVDYGIGFPESDDFGVDFIIPDNTYLLENSHRFKALFISHAHADHFAAVPYLLKEFNVPVYANKLTQAFIKEQFEEKEFKSLKESTKFHLFDATTPPVQIGVFKVSAFNVNHSVPDSLGIVIDTPEGRLLHIADYKIDENPVIDKPLDLNRVAELSKDGVLMMASDCLGSRSAGGVASESTLSETFPKLFERFEGRQVLITTISSNISRMHQIIDAAIKAGRKVVPSGRSIDSTIKIATNLGYLKFPQDVYMDQKEAQDYDQHSVVYIIAGCFGQQGSSLDRVSRGEHRDIVLEQDAVVVFSSEPNPPGVDIAVERMTENLIMAGAEVYDHTNMEHLHVSGHGHREELSKMALTVKPKYYIPIGGGLIHMRAYANMIYDLGVNKGSVYELSEGAVVEFKNGVATRGEKIEVKDMFYDGIGLNPLVVKDRALLSTDGVFVIVVPVYKESRQLAGPVDVVTRGFIYVKESKALLGKSRDIVNKVLDKNPNIIEEWNEVKIKIEKNVQKFLEKETGRTPLIIVHSIFI